MERNINHLQGGLHSIGCSCEPEEPDADAFNQISTKSNNKKGMSSISTFYVAMAVGAILVGTLVVGSTVYFVSRRKAEQYVGSVAPDEYVKQSNEPTPSMSSVSWMRPLSPIEQAAERSRTRFFNTQFRKDQHPTEIPDDADLMTWDSLSPTIMQHGAISLHEFTKPFGLETTHEELVVEEEKM